MNRIHLQHHQGPWSTKENIFLKKKTSPFQGPDPALDGPLVDDNDHDIMIILLSFSLIGIAVSALSFVFSLFIIFSYFVLQTNTYCTKHEPNVKTTRNLQTNRNTLGRENKSALQFTPYEIQFKTRHIHQQKRK